MLGKKQEGYCQACKRWIRTNKKFCPSCGKKFPMVYFEKGQTATVKVLEAEREERR